MEIKILILAFTLATSGTNAGSSSEEPGEDDEYPWTKEDVSKYLKSRRVDDDDEFRKKLKIIYEQTKNIVNQGFYHSTESDTLVKFDQKALKESKEKRNFYNEELPQIKCDKTHERKVSVIDEDTFLAGKQLLDQGLNPVILNLANAHTSGGAVERGAKAQEEELFRRSTYFTCLETSNQNIEKEFEAHYNPSVIVFRGKGSEGFPLLEPDDVYNLAAIAVAGPICWKQEEGWLQEDNKSLSSKAIAFFENKIRTILRIAHQQGHDSVVLGALSCGAFGCPGRQVAHIFKRILRESEFQGPFKKIVFAVMNDRNKNFEKFKRELGELIENN